MNPELVEVYEATLQNDDRSRLDPYRELILRWRRQGKTYRWICKVLGDKFGVRITKSPLHKYVKLRSRARKPQPEIESQLPPLAPAQTLSAAVSGRRLTPEERAAQVEFIRSLNKPEVLVERPKPLFDPDLSKPRTKVKQGD